MPGIAVGRTHFGRDKDCGGHVPLLAPRD
jgi:hypothetical protein